jgi:outer membrane protein assembly factor BamE (lipoprotein component of BamABCDE complex)
MSGLGRLRRLAVALIAVAAIAGCQPIYRDYGYVPSELDLEDVVVGKSTREDVAYEVGRPSSTGVLEGSSWYYVGSRFRTMGIRAPQEIERQVLAISFAEDGTVANIERFALQDGQVITISRRVTDTGIKGSGLIDQLLRNLGNFSAGEFLEE